MSKYVAARVGGGAKDRWGALRNEAETKLGVLKNPMKKEEGASIMVHRVQKHHSEVSWEFLEKEAWARRRRRTSGIVSIS